MCLWHSQNPELLIFAYVVGDSKRLSWLSLNFLKSFSSTMKDFHWWKQPAKLGEILQCMQFLCRCNDIIHKNNWQWNYELLQDIPAAANLELRDLRALSSSTTCFSLLSNVSRTSACTWNSLKGQYNLEPIWHLVNKTIDCTSNSAALRSCKPLSYTNQCMTLY